MADAGQTAGILARSLSSELQHADTLQRVMDVMHASIDLLVRQHSCQAAYGSAIERLSSRSGAHTLQAAAQQADWGAVRASFAVRHAEALATTVLQVVGADWIPQDDSGQLMELVRQLFAALPATAALAALTGHLSLLEPSTIRAARQHHNKQQQAQSIHIEVSGSDTAASLLAERFGADTSTGVQELVAYFAGCRLSANTSDGDIASSHQQPMPQLLQQWPAAHSMGRTYDAHEVARQLASVPDRVGHLPGSPPELLGTRFARHVLTQAMTAVQQHHDHQQQQQLQQREQGLSQESSSGAAGADQERLLSYTRASTSAARTAFVETESPADGNSEGSDAAGMGTVFVAALLQRLVARGHGSAAAGALLPLLPIAASTSSIDSNSRTASALPLVLGQLARSHQAATEKLLTELLLQLGTGTSTQQGAQALHMLLPAAQLQPGAPARYLLTEKLLLHRTLPPAALQLLLAFLDSTEHSLLPGAALSLAQAWAEPQGVNTTKVPQQAYMAQALQCCLALLPREAVAAGAGPLLGALLQGVSAWMGSPLPAVRRQAMRVGRALSLVLDPGKPLFEEQGDLGLLREELWYSPASVAAAAAATAGAVAAGAAADAGAAEAGGQSSTAHGKGTQAGAAQEGAGEQRSGSSAAGSASDGRSTPPPASGRLSATLARLEEVSAASDSDDEDMPGPKTAAGRGASDAGGYASDTGSDAGSDADSIQAYDLHEDLEAEAWEAANWQSAGEPRTAVSEARPVVALRPLAAALRKADDVNAVLDALKRVEVLVRANPEELLTCAPELARSLLHCRTPEWANSEAPTPADAPEALRARALAALLAAAPIEAGDQMLEEVYSPHLDVYQRLLILDSLAAAAKELADPRTAPRLELGDGAPKLLEPRPGARALHGAVERAEQLPASAAEGAGGAVKGSGAAGVGSGEGAAASVGGMRQARTRVWGNVALRKLKEGSSKAPRTFRNRFVGVAVRWASGLLRDCDARRHGVDLFGRDGLLLGRLLTTLGSFAECVAQTHVAVPLAAGLLELLRAPQVSGSEQPFVRRCALLAAAQVVGSLPAARLAGTLVGQGAAAQDAVLVEQLQWLRAWAAGTAAQDADDNCRLLAAAVVGMQAELASASMAALQTLPPPAEHGLRLGVGGAGGSRGLGGLNIEVPRMGQLQLG